MARRRTRSLVKYLAPDYPPLTPDQQRHVHASVAESVGGALRRAPWHIRLAAWGLSITLVTWVAIFGGQARAERSVARFGALGGVFRDGLKLFRSLVVLAYYEHPTVLHAMGIKMDVAQQMAPAREENA